MGGQTIRFSFNKNAGVYFQPRICGAVKTAKIKREQEVRNRKKASEKDFLSINNSR